MKKGGRLHILMGTKGQFVKMAPILRELDRRGINYNFIHTSQHKGITEEISAVFNLREPDTYIVKKEKDLENLPQMAGWFLRALFSGMTCGIWGGHKGIVLLHGDTESTLLGLLLAKAARLKVAHIEAGLRSYKATDPFPEEIIRRLTSRYADLLFAPSPWACDNLKKEGRRGKIYCTEGNTVFDSLRYILSQPEHKSTPLPREPYAVASIHRKETLYVKHRLARAINCVKFAAKRIRVVLILHKKTHYALRKQGLLKSLKDASNITLHYSFLDYLSFMKLVKNSAFVITDGGGLQEETYFLNKPCLLLRRRTERTFGLRTTACLSGFHLHTIESFLDNPESFRREGEIAPVSPSAMIVDVLEKELTS